MALVPVFDGHNDVLLRLWNKQSDSAVADFINGDGVGHMDLPRMEKSGFVGGFFAIFVPNPQDPPHDDNDANPPAALEVANSAAVRPALEMASLLLRIAQQAPDRFRICRTAADIRRAIAEKRIAAIMHVEGAECIDTKFKMLDVLHAAGLKSIGPVWSRPNAFGHGVPFRFPSSPDTGPGLTDHGRAFIKRCNELRIMVDLSHINERGFWDVAKITDAPLVATHSNAHAICPTSRNLTNEQLKAVGQSRGMVGLNYANGFLRRDGSWRSDTPIELMIEHLDHMMALAGEDHVGLGSDYEGARIPAGIGTVEGLPALTDAMAKRGYSDALIRKLCCDNWIALLERTWGA